MNCYPVFLNLKNRDALVVGAGKVGLRKISSLIEGGVREVLVIDNAPESDELYALKQSGKVRFESRDFRAEDIEKKFLVIAATSNKDLNKHINELCNNEQILCNIVDDPESGSFIVPASIRRGEMTIAVSTGGNSPAFARIVRRELEDTFGEHYGFFLTIMGRLRPLVLDLGQETSQNTALFRQLASSSLLDALEDKDKAKVIEILNKNLPDELSIHIPELLDGLV
ncbi:precorrin-2 dehydrogenase/sirohydrochlorin ferrochelatase family protein [Maridesulfovibrio bastinii]|uniref:precorrin-2 dehydrogenase/sirohydrochlorin ferrochelatase family protein n=1 Tax=Maridesulfovibrio bastinii TaxID=47157 RepID=UPI000421131F|nr:bifunctional precorrin-2 dehydrogenase/sirohydrochlorin ferrochelatase [Maridesulfovibrio bastinii]